MIDNQLKEDYLTCKKSIEKYSKTFSIAFSNLPSPKREAVWSLYAFNRILDDLVDEQASKENLEKEWAHFKQLQKGVVTPNYIYRTLFDVDQNFGLNYEAMESMFIGQFQDLEFQEIDTEEALLAYCYNVAGSVGHMLLPVLATINKEHLIESSKNIGIALQITNILRDVGEDYRKGRVYLPSQRIKEYGVDFERIMVDGPDQHYIDLWESYAMMAEKLYANGLEQIELYDEDSRASIRAAALLYKEILNSVRKQNYHLDQRAVVPKSTKLKLFSKLYMS